MSSMLDKLIKFGLGVGIDQGDGVKIKEEIGSDTDSHNENIEQETKWSTDETIDSEGRGEA